MEQGSAVYASGSQQPALEHGNMSNRRRQIMSYKKFNSKSETENERAEQIIMAGFVSIVSSGRGD